MFHQLLFLLSQFPVHSLMFCFDAFFLLTSFFPLFLSSACAYFRAWVLQFLVFWNHPFPLKASSLQQLNDFSSWSIMCLLVEYFQYFLWFTSYAGPRLLLLLVNLLVHFCHCLFVQSFTTNEWKIFNLKIFYLEDFLSLIFCIFRLLL